MKKAIIFLFFLVFCVACGDDGGGSGGGSGGGQENNNGGQESNNIDIADAYPMEEWGTYTTLLDNSDEDSAERARKYDSLTPEQLEYYTDKLQIMGFAEVAGIEEGNGIFIHSNGLKGGMWAYVKDTDGKYIVYWCVDEMDEDDPTPGGLSVFAYPVNAFPNYSSYNMTSGYVYLQSMHMKTNIYKTLTQQDIESYIEVLLDDGFSYNTYTKTYTKLNGNSIYSWMAYPVEVSIDSPVVEDMIKGMYFINWQIWPTA